MRLGRALRKAPSGNGLRLRFLLFLMVRVHFPVLLGANGVRQRSSRASRAEKAPQKFKSRNIPGRWAGGQMTLHPRSDRPSWSSTCHDLHCFVFFLFDPTLPNLTRAPSTVTSFRLMSGPKQPCTATNGLKHGPKGAPLYSTLLRPPPPTPLPARSSPTSTPPHPSASDPPLHHQFVRVGGVEARLLFEHIESLRNMLAFEIY